MKTTTASAAAAVLCTLATVSMGGAAFAQSATPGDSSGSAGGATQSPNSSAGAAMPAINANLSAKPAKGANSFTQGEASSRLASNGFSNVSGLKKDADGIWRGTAMKDGQNANVWLDYTGAVGVQ